MTDNEIIKALECCISENNSCKGCPYISFGLDCTEKRNNDCIDLINRQKAEIERLKTHLEELADEVEDKMTYMCGCKNCIETVKRIIKDDVKPFDMYCDSCNRCKHREAEAVKEFAERLKERFLNLEYRANTTRKTLPIAFVKDQTKWVMHEVSIETIDNLVKEMAGVE